MICNLAIAIDFWDGKCCCYIYQLVIVVCSFCLLFLQYYLKPFAELPGRPTSLIVSDIRARNVNLQFVPGFDGNTIITKWIVEGRIGSSTAWTLVYNIRLTIIIINE